MDITLALGSGGVRGVSHIGVLRFLEEQGFRIRAVAGSSAGSMAGALYAAGYSPRQMEEIFSSINQRRMFGRKPDDGPSLMGINGIANLLTDLLDGKDFNQLRVPFAAVAVDLKTGREVVINQGSVVQAVLASSAVPGVFPPRDIHQLMLIDGGVLNPVPVTVARSFYRDLPVVAVILSQFPPPVEQEMPGFPIPVPGPAQLWDHISRLRIAQAFNIFVQSVNIGSDSLAELRLQVDHPEVVIRPEGVLSYKFLDHANVQELVEIGYRAAKDALPELKRAVSWSGSLRRKFRQAISPEHEFSTSLN